MNFKQIEAFRAVILSGSMTAAARELHTSQPNISRLIAQLERRSALKLFERLSGRLIATPEALAFYRDVERAFVGLDSLEQSAQSIRKLGIGHLRVGAVPSMALTLVPKALKKFSEAYPDVSISLHVNDSIAVAQWTASRYCDIGIASYVSDNPGVNARLIAQMDGVCVLPSSHRLAKRSRPLTPADLEGERFVSLSPGDRRSVDATFASLGHDGRVQAYECPYAAVICKMVAQGMGISIVNPVVVRDFPEPGLVVRRFLPAIPFPTFLLQPLQYPSSRLTEYFVEVLVKYLHDTKERGVVAK